MLSFIESFLEFPGLINPELIFFGQSSLYLGFLIPRLLELKFQPGYLISLFLKCSLVRVFALL